MAQCNLLVVKVLQCNRHFVFSFLVEDYFESASVIVDFEECAHGLLLLGSDATHDDDLQTIPSLDYFLKCSLSVADSLCWVGSHTLLPTKTDR